MPRTVAKAIVSDVNNSDWYTGYPIHNIDMTMASKDII